jgi:flavin-dependent dehydrogenase
MGAHYYQTVIDQKAHLDAEQLPKMGVRFFGSGTDNTDLSKRIEVGFREWPALGSYQLDRGRFENHLGDVARDLGVEFVDECRTKSFEFGPDTHAVTLDKGGKTTEVRAKYLVDATGRQALIRRKLGLDQQISHDCNAAWFRLSDHIKIDEWPAGQEWQDQVPTGTRWLSTNHLCGPGYWLWLIPLGSGSISVGLVADPRYVPWESMRRFEPLMEWIHEHEPQAYKEIDSRRHLLQDFKTLKRYAYGCKQVYSPERWFLVGEAGPFLDPLYSPGSDFIGLGNTFVTDMITRAESGDDTWQERAKPYNDLFLGFFQGTKRLFDGQYGILGHPHAMPAKVVWDTAIYLMVPTMMFTHNLWTDLEFLGTMQDGLVRHGLVGNRAQRFLKRWLDLDTDPGAIGYPRISADTVKEVYDDCITPAPKDELRNKITRYIGILEALYDDMAATVSEHAGVPAPEPTASNNGRSAREVLDDAGIYWAERPSPVPEREFASAELTSA